VCFKTAAGSTVIVDDQWALRIADFGGCEGTAVPGGYRNCLSDGVHVGHNYSRWEAFLDAGRVGVFSLVDGPAQTSAGSASPPDLIKIVTIS
jgi:hypothetical protein